MDWLESITQKTPRGASSDEMTVPVLGLVTAHSARGLRLRENHFILRQVRIPKVELGDVVVRVHAVRLGGVCVKAVHSNSFAP